MSALLKTIRSRRTSKKFNNTAVPHAHLHTLLEAAIWAPNHRQIEPWRFYVLDKAGLEKIDSFFNEHPEVGRWPDPHKTGKLDIIRKRLSQAGAMIHVTSLRSSKEHKDNENYAAACAAVQNMLLMATDLGLGSFWSSNASLRCPQTQEWLGVDTEQERFVASILLGTTLSPAQSDAASAHRQPIADVTTWIE